MVSLLGVQVVQDCEVLNQLFHVGAEVRSTRGTRKDIGSPQVHEAILAKGVAAGEDARDFLLIIVMIVADGARHFHFKLLNSID
jgi:hypothetical protein